VIGGQKVYRADHAKHEFLNQSNHSVVATSERPLLTTWQKSFGKPEKACLLADSLARGHPLLGLRTASRLLSSAPASAPHSVADHLPDNMQEIRTHDFLKVLFGIFA